MSSRNTNLLHQAFAEFDGYLSPDHLVLMLSLVKSALTECPDAAIRDVCDATLGNLIDDVEGLATKAQAQREAEAAAAAYTYPSNRMDIDAIYRAGL